VFTFTGARKPAEPADADLAKAGAHAARAPGTTAR
jgi:ATP-dependent Clp protease ATP-binding subunit ClpC